MAFKAKELLNEFLDVQQKPLRDVQSRSLVRWNSPSEGMYEENFDGVIFYKLSLAGIAVVIRNSYRNVIVALSQKIPLPHSVDLVEALAAIKAVSFARELCISKVEFEGTRLASTSSQIWARSESSDSAYDVDLEILMALKFVGWIPAICVAFWIALYVWSEA